jgi:hypothetical protein
MKSVVSQKMPRSNALYLLCKIKKVMPKNHDEEEKEKMFARLSAVCPYRTALISRMGALKVVFSQVIFLLE